MTSSRIRGGRIRSVARWAATCGIVACAPASPVDWTGTHRVPGAVEPGASVVIGAGGVPAVRPAFVPVRWPDDSAACAGSEVGLRAAGDTVVAVWWSAGPLTAIRLRVAHSPDGGITWEDGVAVGLAADEAAGCRRPPPGVDVDETTGLVHVAYFGSVGEQSGIVTGQLARHARAAAAPRLVAEAGGPAAAAIAASGDTLVVAFESADSAGSAVWLAILMGTEQIPVMLGKMSESGARAFAPMAAIREGRIAVAWNQARRGADAPLAVARVGRIRR